MTTTQATLFGTLEELGYGELHFGRDAQTGLRAIVGIHSTRLGPAMGGTRIRAYETEADAIDDVARLAKAMTYKAALARLPQGGGKAVILAPADLAKWDGDRRAALFRAFGRFVDGLGGRYITTEDSGTSSRDMDVIRTVTKHVVGGSPERGGSGDPSPWTALGCRRGIEAIAHHVLGRSDLNGVHVALQGVGAVGGHLARELHRAGAKLTIADTDAGRVEAIAKETGAEVVSPDAILEVECDVLAPNAFGGAISVTTVPRLRAKAIGGAANNQLRTPEAGRMLKARNIFYAPDYAINAGGLIHVSDEYVGYDRERVIDRCTRVYDTIAEIIQRSRREGVLPEVVADQWADEIIAAGPSHR